MTDDQGYGVSGTFGGVIPTPALDRVAKAGLRYTQYPLHLALLAHAGCADHRAQPSLGGLRRDHRVVHGLPGLRFHHRSGERHDRRDPQREWLCHVMVRQEPQYARLSIQHGRSLRPMALGDGLRLLLRVHGRRDRPVGAVPVPRSYPDLPLDRKARLQPDYRYGG